MGTPWAHEPWESDAVPRSLTFTRAGDPTKLLVRATTLLVGPEAERLPLDSITHEDGDNEIAIGLGGRGQKFQAVLWHFVEKPRHVWVIERGEEPEPAVIAIQSEDGSRTLLHLNPGRSS